ncbi:hypothetical protein MKZ38_004619 [Zalerion maritima]|uniref:Sphingoid long-chain base transporter RSB1 n=1 Tax=Zalerion maritima TaxID=339359 RepID=A0AAD5WQY2_9PEZI|nr:hypothetical protein MKZ38_004619 [Zalerion maritima]
MSSSTDIPPPSASSDMPDWCVDHVDSPYCDDVEGHYQYDISLPANAVFLAIFSLSLLLYLATFAIKRTGLAFTVAMVLGSICEILGYAGRVMGHLNRFDMNGFLIQICCLTIGPAFMAAGIYLCLRRIVYVFGKEGSRIKPEMYTRIFIPCDVISLILQAAGGGIASVASQNDDYDGVTMGDNIMIAGLSFQVFTLFCFSAISVDFALRTRRRIKSLGEGSALEQDPEFAKVRKSFMFRGFLCALALATLCILIRSVFRVAELSKGWSGPIMGNQAMFIGFEGALIVVAVLVLNVFHPAVCFKKVFEGQGGIGWGNKGKGNKVKGGDMSVYEGQRDGTGTGGSASESGAVEKASAKGIAV